MEGVLAVIKAFSVIALLCNFAGNSIVIAVLHKVKSMQTSTNYMLGVMANNDLVFGALAFSEICIYFFVDKIDDVLNLQYSFQLLVRAFLSSFTLAAIAVERYYAILKPFVHRAKMSKKLVKRVMGCIWIAAVIIYMPLFFVPYNYRKMPYILASLIITTVIPGIIMTTCYSQIVYRIWFKTQERQTTNAGVLKSRKKLTKLLVTITLVFFVCWSPLLGRSFDFQSHQHKTFYYMLSGLLAVTGTAINPVLYSLHSVRFRQAVRELFGSRLRWRKSRVVGDIHRPETHLQITSM